MSDKNLLNENTIRRFMKLANVGTLTNNFISEMGYKRDDEEPETPHVDGGPISEQEEEEMEMDVEMADVEEEEPEMDDELMDDEPMDDEPMDEADISLTEEEAQLLIDLGDRLRDAMDAEEGDMDMDEPEDMDLEEPEDMDMEEPEDMDMEEPEEEEPEEEEVLQEALVAEVLKRVTRRIIREKTERK